MKTKKDVFLYLSLVLLLLTLSIISFNGVVISSLSYLLFYQIKESGANK